MSTHDDLALPQPEQVKVVVTDIRMPFMSMVTFMVKWALASIPAMFVIAAVGVGLAIAGTTFLAVFTGVVGGLAGSP